MPKNNPWTHSPQRNKSTVLMTAAYFKVSTAVRSHRDNNRASFTFVYQKGCFQYKTEKVNTTIEFRIFKLVYVLNFSLNWLFWFFGPNLPKKCFRSETEKVNTATEFCIFELIYVLNFSINWHLIFWTKFA